MHIIDFKKIAWFSDDDDDDFYDRTKKKPSARKTSEQPSVETADTLLNKKEAIISEMEEKKALLMKEKDKLVTTAKSCSEGGDDLDAYMSGLSSQLGKFFFSAHYVNLIRSTNLFLLTAYITRASPDEITPTKGKKTQNVCAYIQREMFSSISYVVHFHN